MLFERHAGAVKEVHVCRRIRSDESEERRRQWMKKQSVRG